MLLAIPGFILAFIGLGAVTTLYLFKAEMGPRVTNIGLVAPLVALACILVPVAGC